MFGPGRRFSAIQELTIRNVGYAPATDVRGSVSPDDLPGILRKPFREMSIFTTPITYLPERQEVSTYFLDWREVQMTVDDDIVLTFTVTYRTMKGEQTSHVASYNLGVYRDMTDFKTTDLGDVVEELKHLVGEAKKQTSATETARTRFFPEADRFSLSAWLQERWSLLRHGRRMRFHRAVVNILNPNGTMHGSATAALWCAMKCGGSESWGGTLHMPFINSAQVAPQEDGTKVILQVSGGEQSWVTITRYIGGTRQRARFRGDGAAPF